MAIARDNNSGSGVFAHSGDSYTVNTSGSCIILEGNDITSVSWNGNSMSQLGTTMTTSGETHRVYGLANCTAATGTLTWTGGGGSVVQSWSGVSTSAPFGNVTTQANGGSSVSVTASASTSWVWCGWTSATTSCSLSSGPIAWVTGASDGLGGGDTNGTVSAGTVTENVTTSSATILAMVELKVPTASGPANVKTWDAVTQSTGIKTYESVALASTKSVIGVT